MTDKERGQGPKSLSARLNFLSDSIERYADDLIIAAKNKDFDTVHNTAKKLQCIWDIIEDLLSKVHVDHETGVESVDGWGIS